MLTMKIQDSLVKFGQVEVLMEMLLNCLVNDPCDTRDIKWFAKLENALYLLETTYREKMDDLISALKDDDYAKR